jgi:hypothetical protein
MPMLWGWNQVSRFSQVVHSGYAHIALGFNEPNEPSQSNIDTQNGAKLWRTYIAPLRYQGYRLGSPATTSAPSGFSWLQDFLRICPDCNWDITALHYYDISPEAFITYVKKFHDGFGRNVMVTEYACQNFNGGAQCSRDQTFRFHSMARDFFESTPWVEAYFPFGVMHDMVNVNPANQLMAGNGQPTDLFRVYSG